VLAALLLLALMAAGWWVVRRYRSRAAARAARLELQRLKAAFDRGGDPGDFARGISRLLRRYAMARFPRRQVAGLCGADWLEFLDRKGGRGGFRVGPGRVLTSAPYRRQSEVQVDELTDLVEEWIERNPAGEPTG
jgi:hypothetical protein